MTDHPVVERLRRRIETRQMRPNDPRNEVIGFHRDGEDWDARRVYAHLRKKIALYEGYRTAAMRAEVMEELEKWDTLFQRRFGDPPKKRGK